ncbi:MAG TPA: DUF2156 domain-containing protein [Epulopiscium sp.]|nr:DUF2156 domain-containing protein [Candidatus Epulonipiscium sp.]
MIDFKEIQLEDITWMKPLIKEANMAGCHQNFGNIFAWSKVNDKCVARMNDYLIVKVNADSKKSIYFYPAGVGEIKPIIDAMKQDALENGQVLRFDGLSPENMEVLNNLYPNQFKYKRVRDNFDYVYLIEKMVSLAGKKLSGKRNHINKFIRSNEWHFEEMTPDNLNDCWEMNKQWSIENGADDNGSLAEEACAVKRLLKNFSQLELEGGLIRVGGDVVAYTIGERLNSDTYVIHVEKAFAHIQGAYPMINREFIAVINERYPDLMYVNREEDIGDLGLRKAKKSYYPEKMEEKYMGKYIGD